MFASPRNEKVCNCDQFKKTFSKSPEKEDPIAISSFPIDVAQTASDGRVQRRGVVNEDEFFPVKKEKSEAGPNVYHVPYRSILPQPDNVTIPTRAVALSCTQRRLSSLAGSRGAG